MSISVVFSQMIQMFLMMMLGYGLRKGGLMDQAFTSKMVTFLLDVSAPCLILNSVLAGEGERNLALVGMTFAIAIALLVFLLPLISLVLVKLLRFPKKQQGLYIFMFAYSNVGFMGFPLIDALFGGDALIYTAIFNIIFNISTYTVGVMILHIGLNQKAALDPKLFLTPMVLLSFLAVILYLLNPPVPEAIVSVTGSLGDMTTPAAMLCLGSTLASMPLRDVVDDWRVYLFSVIKQILLPLAALPLLRLVISDTVLLGVIYVLLLTPVANAAVLLATEYGFDEKLAAKGVFVSTVLSVVTIPLLGALL